MTEKEIIYFYVFLVLLTVAVSVAGVLIFKTLDKLNDTVKAQSRLLDGRNGNFLIALYAFDDPEGLLFVQYAKTEDEAKGRAGMLTLYNKGCKAVVFELSLRGKVIGKPYVSETPLDELIPFDEPFNKGENE